MKTKVHHLFIALAFLCALNSPLTNIFAQGTAFTYQGRLDLGTNPVTGVYNFKFDVWNDPSAGSVIGGPVTNTAVPVTNGLFTTIIDFGSGVFSGTTNWLHIQVTTNGNSVFASLLPREELTPTPYALYAETANGAGIRGAVPASDLNLSGVSGSGLVSLNGSAVTSGTVGAAFLPTDVAYTDVNQTFTGANIFETGIGAGSLTLQGTSGINTSVFTGLGLQYYQLTGEGAILSAYDSLDFGDGFLSFYTKSIGAPVSKQMIIDYYGGVAIDQQGANGGVINNGTTNGVGLTFGVGSGEGIASQRQPGTAANQYGLDFYTDFARRLSISQQGLVGINVGTNKPTTQLEVNGALRTDGSELYLEPSTAGLYANDGLVFGDGSLPGINYLNNGPWLAGYEGGALGGLDPNVVALSWDANGDCWVSNYISAGSVIVRNNSTAATQTLSVNSSGYLTANGSYLQINGASAYDGDGAIDAYIGGNGSGSDVQVGSFNSLISNVAFYNWGNNSYMHIYCSSITIEGGADLAEPFKITKADKPVEEGEVVVIDDAHPGQLKLTDQPYDTRVAGVVSGANGIHPGIQMHQQGLLEGGQNVALTGRVYVQADASNGPIKPGDLLTTSSTPGRAMRVSDHLRAQGAILGKAMTALQEGQGMVLVLVTLQ